MRTIRKHIIIPSWSISRMRSPSYGWSSARFSFIREPTLRALRASQWLPTYLTILWMLTLMHIGSPSRTSSCQVHPNSSRISSQIEGKPPFSCQNLSAISSAGWQSSLTKKRQVQLSVFWEKFRALWNGEWWICSENTSMIYWGLYLRFLFY